MVRSSGNNVRQISVAHSPDSDDAFMFYGMATNKIRVPGVKFTHTLCDIETLNRKARWEGGFLRHHRNFVPRLSLHSGQVRDHALRRQRGRRLRADDCRFANPMSLDEVRKNVVVAVPDHDHGIPDAFKLFAPGIVTEVVPFDEIIPARARR